DPAGELVDDREAEPDRELAPEIRPTTWQVAPPDCDHGPHAAILPSDVGHLDPGQVGCRLRTELRIAVFAALPHASDALGELLVRGAAPDHGPEIVAANREQAREEAPFGGEPRAGAVAAERLGHRRDHAHLAPA